MLEILPVGKKRNFFIFFNFHIRCAVGIIGAALVIADAANSSTFIKILVVEIFASALSIFSVIVGIVVATQAHFNG